MMRFSTRGLATLLMAAGAIYGMASPVAAQNRSIFVVSGYGTTTYEAATTSEFPNDFSASVSPVFLYTMGQDLLFETELEFALDGPETESGLEYAQIDYLGFENFQIIAGKFLLPFGTFGERTHPTWINKLPTKPVLFGHSEGGVAEGGLLPIMADAGAMVRWAKPLSGMFRLDFSGYVTQGPILAPPEEEDGGEVGLPIEEIEVPRVAFGVAFKDNNTNKMVGARAGLTNGRFGVYLSGFTAKYDDDGDLTFRGGALSADWQTGAFDIRGEAVATLQEFVLDGSVRDQKRSGFYAQIARRFGSLEPVVRIGALTAAKVADMETIDSHQELALGVAYWLRPTIPVKFSYEIHANKDNRIYVQWAYGF